MAITTGVAFPPEIIEEILLRLPAKTLCRSKCVSKQWKSLISSPRFITNHLDFSNRLHREKLILVSHDLSLYTADLLDLQNGPVPALMATELRSVPRANFIAGRCNGLITTSLKENDAIFVINPITGQFTEMCTDPEEPSNDEGETEVVGVGCDSSTDDYTIVIIDWRDVEGAGRRIRVANVASFRSNGRTFTEGIKIPSNYHVHRSSATYSSAIYSFVTSVYLNGCVHWLCHRGSNSSWFIACFSPQNGKFEEIGLPDFIGAEKSLVVRPLLVVSGCLCVFTVRDNFFAQLWVMKEYRVRESWKKIPIYGLGTSTAEPLYLLGDREVVLAVDWAKDGVVVYNVDKKRMQKVKISGIPTRFGFWGTCVDSLVSPPPLLLGNKDDRPEAGFEG